MSLPSQDASTAAEYIGMLEEQTNFIQDRLDAANGLYVQQLRDKQAVDDRIEALEVEQSEKKQSMALVVRVLAADKRRQEALQKGDISDPADYVDEDEEAAALEPGSLPTVADLEHELDRIAGSLRDMQAARTKTEAQTERTKDKRRVLEEQLALRKDQLNQAKAGGGNALAKHAAGLSQMPFDGAASGAGANPGT